MGSTAGASEERATTRTAVQAAAQTGALIRVDQLGFAIGESKSAYLMSPKVAAGQPYAVIDRHGRKVLSGRTGADLGKWNDAYPHVYALELKGLLLPGTYRVQAAGATSAPFQVGTRGMFRQAADKTITFFGSQRDGVNVVPGQLDRKPAHLTDKSAQVYELPVFESPDSGTTVGELKPVPGEKVDVEGGWFDAGDYVKFTHIAAYADLMLWASARDGRAGDAKLVGEARHGLKWLDKMWDEKTRTVYMQVGIGSGNAEETFAGDHDVWRLPEEDDADNDPYHRHLKNRPVFRAAAPGEKVSPNIAGRMAAAFAIAAQVEPNRTKARGYLTTAAQIYAQAKTTGVTQLTTSLPFAYYPENRWRDDLELGAAELSLAAKRLGDPRSKVWLDQAKHWAGQYLLHEKGGSVGPQDKGGSLDLYDVSALAHADLIRAIRAHGGSSASTRDIAGDLKAQLDRGLARAGQDPFRAGAKYDDFDAIPKTFGLVATSHLYRQVTGDRRYDALGTQQRNWALGSNPWGTSFVVGVGTSYVQCPHHQVANILGKPAIGAVVNGPNNVDFFEGGFYGHMDRMKPCPANGVDSHEVFSARGARYVDDVRSWQTAEPAIDFAVTAAYALTLEGNGLF
ncbi:glycoside hydrolase family 9 protein [Kribbella deserti]|uniref:Glycoside hydrolase family 9 protein n=1 Tax=Kribbella deserti TaxID=1926257 RepID=A0ABV6QM07_9ACTN